MTSFDLSWPREAHNISVNQKNLFEKLYHVRITKNESLYSMFANLQFWCFSIRIHEPRKLSTLSAYNPGTAINFQIQSWGKSTRLKIVGALSWVAPGNTSENIKTPFLLEAKNAFCLKKPHVKSRNITHFKLPGTVQNSHQNSMSSVYKRHLICHIFRYDPVVPWPMQIIFENFSFVRKTHVFYRPQMSTNLWYSAS